MVFTLFGVDSTVLVFPEYPDLNVRESDVLAPRQLSKGRGFSKHIFFFWISLSVASATKYAHVTELITKYEKGRGWGQ